MNRKLLKTISGIVTLVMVLICLVNLVFQNSSFKFRLLGLPITGEEPCIPFWGCLFC